MSAKNADNKADPIKVKSKSTYAYTTVELGPIPYELKACTMNLYEEMLKCSEV